jgi:predicted AAA+ superfamily ATPase
LLGYYVYPYAKKIKRDVITATPKFYLFDVGVANFLAKQQIVELKGAAAGKSFEHFIFMELMAYINLTRKRRAITYWRTKTGLEVDFILGDAEVALEVKISEHVHKEDLKGLIAFCEEHAQAKAIVISQDEHPRMLKINDQLTISILPWKTFLKRLWKEEIII